MNPLQRYRNGNVALNASRDNSIRVPSIMLIPHFCEVSPDLNDSMLCVILCWINKRIKTNLKESPDYASIPFVKGKLIFFFFGFFLRAWNEFQFSIIVTWRISIRKNDDILLERWQYLFMIDFLLEYGFLNRFLSLWSVK